MKYNAIRTVATFMAPKEPGSIIYRLSRMLEERRRKREQRNLMAFVTRNNRRPKPDKLCEDDACVERIRLNDGPMEG